ncbi:sensor histidine kinase [bacterium]|nr:sensor histidine kinase [bacterium]
MKSVFFKLTLIFLLSAIIPVIVFHTISISRIGQVSKEQVMQANLEVARATTRDVSNYFDNSFDILQNLSRELEQFSYTQDEYDHLLKMAFANYPYFQYLMITDLDGNVLEQSQFEKPPAVDLREKTPQLLKGQMAISDVYIAQNPPPVRPAISVYLPIKKEGKVQKVLVAELNLIYAWHLVHQMKIGKTGEAFLVDAKGNIFASSNMSVLFELKPYPGFSDFIHGSQSFIQTLNSNRYLVSLMPLDLPFGGILLVREPTEEAFQLANHLSIQMLVLTILVIALMLVVGYWSVKKMVVSPVKTLTLGLEEIAHGNWEHRIRLDTHDEFSDMGGHYNEMAQQLSFQAGQIRKQERLSLIGKIAGGLVHDLKHPITNIRNWAKLMPTKAGDPKFVTDFSNVVTREFNNVDLFFSNLKDLTSEMPFNRSDINIGKLLADLKSRFELQAVDKKIELIFDADNEHVVKADYFLLVRVLSNLMTNALQALPNGGIIKLNVNSDFGKTLFEVNDNGIGIPADKLETLFDDFTTTKRKGLGLGLAISKKIIELHGGVISVVSEQGKGTTFSFWIPENK